MKLITTYSGSDDPFEGDLTVYLRGLPVGAHATKATVKLTPVAATDGELFVEEIDTFNSSGSGKLLSATKVTSTKFVEVDFHARRTLAEVEGSNIFPTVGTVSSKGASLEVDVGGTLIEVNRRGALGGTSTDLFELQGDGKLPALAVNKLRLSLDPTDSNAKDPDVDTVTIRSVPTNLTVKLGQTPPFWVRIGELASEDTSPDFAEALNAFLLSAPNENGYYQIPFVIHSDTLARLNVELNIEYVIEKAILPPHLPDITLPYNFSTLPGADEALTTVAIPRQAIPVSGMSGAQVRGEFQPTRVRKGAIGEEPPTFPVRVASDCSLAQAFQSDIEIVLSGVDLPLANTQPGLAGMNVALRADDDGKPSGEVLIRADVHIEKPLPGQSSWGSATLPSPFRILPGERYWLVLQSLVGEAYWNATAGTPDIRNLQCSRDGGLSWRAASAQGAPFVLAALLRLRDKPDRFSIPVQLQIGKGASAVRRRLDEFAPLGRIEFNFDFAEKLTEHLAKPEITSPCDTGELLTNGGFDDPPHDDATVRLFGSMNPKGVGTVDLSQGVDLSTERFITLSVVTSTTGTNLPMRIDCAGVDPARTSLDEIILTTTRAVGRQVFEIVNGKNLGIVSGLEVDVLPWCKTGVPTSWQGEAGRVIRVRVFATVLVVLVAPPSIFENELFCFNDGSSALDPLAPAELSQRFSVVGGCHYLLRFLYTYGNTSTNVSHEELPPPLAQWQIHWLDTDGQIFATNEAALATPYGGGLGSSIYETRIIAPTKAVEAELRFLLDPPSILVLENASVIPTIERLANTNFRQWEHVPYGIIPAGWSRLSGRIKRDTLLGRDSPITILESGGPEDTILAQKSDVTAGDQYELQVTAHPELRPADDASTRPTNLRARLELLWHDNVSQIDGRVILPLDGRDFSTHAWSGKAPENATQAEIRLIQPNGTDNNLLVKSVSFTRVDLVDVPLIFLAEAPGELNVSDLRATYDLPEPSAQLGLLSQDPDQAQARTRVVSSATSTSVTSVVVTRPITDVNGIGDGRAKQLTKAGIDSLEKLAKASPEDVAGVLNAVSVEMAIRFIEDASDLIA
jgi:hypothetical protein